MSQTNSASKQQQHDDEFRKARFLGCRTWSSASRCAATEAHCRVLQTVHQFRIIAALTGCRVLRDVWTDGVIDDGTAVSPTTRDLRFEVGEVTGRSQKITMNHDVLNYRASRALISASSVGRPGKLLSLSVSTSSKPTVWPSYVGLHYRSDTSGRISNSFRCNEHECPPTSISVVVCDGRNYGPKSISMCRVPPPNGRSQSREINIQTSRSSRALIKDGVLAYMRMHSCQEGLVRFRVIHIRVSICSLSGALILEGVLPRYGRVLEEKPLSEFCLMLISTRELLFSSSYVGIVMLSWRSSCDALE